MRDWVRALPADADSPIERLEKLLLAHLERLDGELSTRMKSTLLGVSAPTYQKRVRYYATQAVPGDELMEMEP